MDATFTGWKKFTEKFEIKNSLLKFSKNTTFNVVNCRISYLGEIFGKKSVKFEELNSKKETKIYLIGTEDEEKAKEIFQYCQKSKESDSKSNEENEDVDDNELQEMIDDLEFTSDKKTMASTDKNIDFLFISNMISKIESGEFIKGAITMKHEINPQEPYLGKNTESLLLGLTPEWYRTEDSIESESEKYLPNQRAIFLRILKKIGKAIFATSSIMKMSLPVVIFDKHSLLKRVFEKFSSAVYYFRKVDKTTSDIEILDIGVKFLLKSCSMGLQQLKPFNPIIGETAQYWIDGCPFYLEQISHHPPITAFLLIGKNFRMHGKIEFNVNLSLKSIGISYNGTWTIEFPEIKKTLKLIYPYGLIEGLMGTRKLYLQNKSFLLLKESNLMVDLTFEHGKAGFFKSIFSKTRRDLFEAKYYQINEGLTKILDKEENCLNYTKINLSKYQLTEIDNGSGLWHLEYNKGKEKVNIWKNDEIKTEFHYEDFPLPSDSNYRRDIIHWIGNDEENSNLWKEELEKIQRSDRDLRKRQNKIK